MAKELPYFKFEPGGWENGKIQVCSFEAQGIFINVCSMYWQRLGDLSYKLAVQKICKGNATAFDSLVDEGVLKVDNGMICIDFLNEQLAEFEDLSKTNSKNARSGWEKRKNNATALQSESDPNAIREEKKREDKRKEENKKPFDVPFLNGSLAAWNEWEKHRIEIKKKLTPSTAKKQIQFLGGRGDPEIIAIINQSIEKGWTGLFELKNNTYVRNQEPIRTVDAIIPTNKSFGAKEGFPKH